MIINNRYLKRSLLGLLLVVVCTGWLPAQMTREVERVFKEQFENDKFHFLILNDAGYNGYKDQVPIAQTMGQVAEVSEAGFVLSNGDQHHFHGVQGIYDPLWTSNFEIIYTHPALLEIPWYAVAGNHEYRGNVDAFIQYNTISQRWKMPSRYYTFEIAIEEKCRLRILMLDTTPMMDRYRKDGGNAALQNYESQLCWIDSVLTVSKADWTIVLGHHPVYAASTKDSTEQTDLQNRLDPVLRKHHVDFYFSGHVHNFQHIVRENSPLVYVVNSSASSSRRVKDPDGLTFWDNSSGFSICEVDKNAFSISFISRKGEIIYTITKNK